VSAGHHIVEFRRIVVPVDFGKDGQFTLRAEIAGHTTTMMRRSTASVERKIEVKP
jgi:hypothetical protein